MPMKNVSTPLKTTGNMLPSSQRHQSAPRKSTILLIRQFARAYSCPATLPVALGSFVAN